MNILEPARKKRRFLEVQSSFKESENLRSQIIDDDSLLRIFSFLPPIPYFFAKIPLINKQLYQYFFSFVTTCPIDELNYFREMNFWDFGFYREDPENRSDLEALSNHFRLLFGERGNLFFNILQKRLIEATEILYVPFWKDIARKIVNSEILLSFERLHTVVLPQTCSQGTILEEISRFFSLFLNNSLLPVILKKITKKWKKN